MLCIHVIDSNTNLAFNQEHKLNEMIIKNKTKYTLNKTNDTLYHDKLL